MKNRRGLTTVAMGLACVLVAGGLARGETPVWGRVAISAVVGDVIPFRFAVTNAGPERLRIRDVKSSCKCLRVRARPQFVGPGTSEPIEVSLVPNATGAYAYQLDVFYGGSTEPAGRFVMDVDVSATADSPPVDPLTLLPAPGSRSRQRGLYVSLPALDRECATGSQPILVDVRMPDEYRRMRIPKSMSVQPFALTTRTFLRNKDVILVDRGWGDRILEKKCIKMRAAGFRSVRILEGGLNAWDRAGRPLTGEDVRRSELARMTPREYLSVGAMDDWAVVPLGQREPGGRPRLAHRLASATPADSRAQLAEGPDGAPPRRVASARVLVLSADGSGYGDGQPPDTNLADRAVFHLEGGEEGMLKELKIMAAMRRARVEQTRRGTVVRGGRPVIRKPCSTCPGGGH